MKQSNKKCGYCASFAAYYTRGYCSMTKEKIGYCSHCKKIMDRGDSCDRWRCRHTSRNVRALIAINCIPEIYNKIAVIEQILNEEIEQRRIKTETDNIEV